MLSHKLLSLEKLVELASTGEVMPTRAVMKVALRNIRDCRAEAERLEQRVIPRRQRLQLEDLKSGKVAMFPVAARPEAQS